MQLLNIIKIQEGYYSVDSLPCPECKTSINQIISAPQLWDYNQGAHAQTVLPNLRPLDRERFISGLCDTCWQASFPADDGYYETQYTD